MKHTLTTFAFALLSLGAQVALAQTALSHSVSDGATTRTRTLHEDGTYAETLCVTPLDGGQQCVARSRKLNAREMAAVKSDIVAAGVLLEQSAASASQSMQHGLSQRSAGGTSVSRSGADIASRGYSAESLRQVLGILDASSTKGN